ncbi:hypothetical protein BPO_1815 [Bergeyella porcorum]|uniref:Glycosyltransferase family 1 protein n=1 Tax=Bergeyella porcorum TaxID=1735111 RepID=A0AAU0F522_9FLAO
MDINKKINTLKRKFDISKYPKNGNVIIVLVPFSNVINGGHLSIANIYHTLKRHYNLHHSTVLLSYLFLTNTPNHTHFTEFKNNAFIQDLRTILSHFKSFNSLQFYIPESYIRFFVNEYHNFWPKHFKDKLICASKLSFNILNQNDEYMNLNDIEDLRNISTNITMTLAHKQYTTKEKRNKYNVPIHHLSAWLNDGKYEKKHFKDKENIILYSPDEVKHQSGIKNEIITKVKENFPSYQVIQIKDFSYEKYKNLISKAKFMLTFGEGLDGYFIENTFCGGVSFAVYNEVFFTPNYKNLSTTYNSYNEMKDKIVEHINYLDNEKTFEKTNNEILCEIEKEYSFEIFENKLINFLKGNLDYL